MRLKPTKDYPRLDQFLAEALEDVSRSAAQKLLEQGNVLLNGRLPKKNDPVSPGDTVDVTLPEPKTPDVAPVPMDLDIVYEDSDVLVLCKPKGLVVHPAAGHSDDTLVSGLLYAMEGSLSGINGVLRPGIVHRIDKDTSGLLAVAKNDAAHLALSDQLKDHTMARSYEAIVCGSLREDSGTVCAPIGRSRKDRKKMAVTPDGKAAVTHWQVLGRYRGYTHIRCRLETGRTHQIRVHMAHIGHPILGDTVYGGKAAFGQDTQCLHAAQLTFLHPRTGEAVTVRSPLPGYFTETLSKLEKL